MSNSNGARDFTHTLTPFTLEGVTFQRRKVDPIKWGEVLERTGAKERKVGEEGGVTLQVSAEGMHELILLAINEEQHDAWNELREAGRIEWGELTAIREWLWEQMTDHPFPDGYTLFVWGWGNRGLIRGRVALQGGRPEELSVRDYCDAQYALMVDDMLRKGISLDEAVELLGGFGDDGGAVDDDAPVGNAEDGVTAEEALTARRNAEVMGMIDGALGG